MRFSFLKSLWWPLVPGLPCAKWTPFKLSSPANAQDVHRFGQKTWEILILSAWEKKCQVPTRIDFHAPWRAVLLKYNLYFSKSQSESRVFCPMEFVACRLFLINYYGDLIPGVITEVSARSTCFILFSVLLYSSYFSFLQELVITFTFECLSCSSSISLVYILSLLLFIS